MKGIYRETERVFEKFSDFVMRIIGNSITFMIAFALVVFWILQPGFRGENFHELLRDIILAVTFLTFFIIQRTYNRLTYAMHLKLNELIAAQENASNKLLKAEEMTEMEMKELGKRHDDIIQEETIRTENDNRKTKKNKVK